MSTNSPHPSIGTLLSGGLDSAILLGLLIERGYRVQPLYVRSGLVWEPEELHAVRRFLEAISGPRLAPMVTLELPVADLYGDHWSMSGCQVPDEWSADAAVYLHGRNALLIIKAALWCQLHGIGELALGVLSTNPFRDASPEFFRDLESALNFAAGKGLRIRRPLADMTKRQVMELGKGLPLELTFSCISPVEGLHCGHCNKCAERSVAFGLIGIEDPTDYAQPLTKS
jgi:7-cyano-7-deazaguanine synthase